MPKLGVNVSCEDFKKLRDQLQNMSDNHDEILTSLTKEIAARLLRQTKQRTPVGKSRKGHVGGTLRRNWKVGEIQKSGDTYYITISNNTEYAPYVEYGHRTRDHKNWVRGQYMLTLSEKDIQSKADAIIRAKLERLLKDAMK